MLLGGCAAQPFPLLAKGDGKRGLLCALLFLSVPCWARGLLCALSLTEEPLAVLGAVLGECGQDKCRRRAALGDGVSLPETSWMGRAAVGSVLP